MLSVLRSVLLQKFATVGPGLRDSGKQQYLLLPTATYADYCKLISLFFFC